MEVIEWLTSETVRRPNDTSLAVSADRMSRALGQEPSELQRELVQLLQTRAIRETECPGCGGSRAILRRMHNTKRDELR